MHEIRIIEHARRAFRGVAIEIVLVDDIHENLRQAECHRTAILWIADQLRQRTNPIGRRDDERGQLRGRRRQSTLVSREALGEQRTCDLVLRGPLSQPFAQGFND